MNENTREATPTALESRSQALFHDSVDGIDMAVLSRLNQARQAALEAAVRPTRPWFLRLSMWTPAASAAAAAILGVALWFGTPLGNHGAPGVQTSLEDLDMVASSDNGSGDALEMLQDDIDFYDFADKAAAAEPAA